jgi:hypothetical protein
MPRYSRDDVPLRFPTGEIASRPWLDAHPLDREALYRRAARGRVVCQCQPFGVEMIVRLRGDTHHLANLPARSHHHASSCPSYAPDPSTDARLDYARTALIATDGSLSITVLDAPTRVAPYPHVTPRAALELLWRHGELAHWVPRMSRRRTAVTVRTRLVEVAREVTVNGDSLARHLYLPAPGVPRGARQPRFVIGEVHRVVNGPHSRGVLLRHDTTSPYWVAPAAWPELLNLLDAQPVDPALGPVWVFGRAWYTPQHAHFEWVGALEVTAQWLPIVHPAERALLRLLIDEQRRFVRVLPLDSAGDPRFPVVTLTDTAPPVDLHNPTVRRLPVPFAAAPSDQSANILAAASARPMPPTVGTSARAADSAVKSARHDGAVGPDDPSAHGAVVAPALRDLR